jgi:hypothetical protein
MPSVKERHSNKHSHEHVDSHQHDEEVASTHESGSNTGSEGSEEEDEEDEEEDDEEEGSEVNIDLSDNDFYKGMCTLLEDDNGNNIVRYVDLLCEHTKEISDNVKHLEGMRQDIHRIAKSFEKFVSLQEQFMTKQMSGGAHVMPPPAPKKEHHSSEATREATRVDDATVKSSKKSSSQSDDITVKSSKTQKSSKH